MKTLKIMVFLFVVILLAGFGFYAYMGGFYTVKVEKGDYAATEIVYSTYKGPYKDLGNVWIKFQKTLDSAGLKKCDGLAVYLDPPSVPQSDLRSIIACDISNLSDQEKMELRSKLMNFVLPSAQVVQGSFPFKNKLSYFYGPMRVYPKLMAMFLTEMKKPPLAIEVYGTEKIDYIMPVGIDKVAYQKLYNSFN